MINTYSILNRAKYFSLNGLHNYLVFQLFINYFLTENSKIDWWTSKGISRESITPPSTKDKSFYPEVIHLFGVKYDLKFKGICLK